MQDHLARPGMLVEHRERVIVGLARVDHDRLPDLARDLDLG